jgi:hypothetical protein
MGYFEKMKALIWPHNAWSGHVAAHGRPLLPTRNRTSEDQRARQQLNRESGTAQPHRRDQIRAPGYSAGVGSSSRARRIRTLRVDVAGELGRGGDLTGSSGSGAAASADAWPSGTGAYSLSSGIAIEGPDTPRRTFRKLLAGRGGGGRSRGRPRRGSKQGGWAPLDTSSSSSGRGQLNQTAVQHLRKQLVAESSSKGTRHLK